MPQVPQPDSNNKAATVVSTTSSHPSSPSPTTSSNYFKTLPGVLRVLNIVVGLSSAVLRGIGIEDDWETVDDASLLYVSYYGLGYKTEPINIWSLAIISTATAISLAAVITIARNHNHSTSIRPPWNGFLHLFLSILTLLGWLCGLLGFLQFRQGCCRVDILSSERIRSSQEGYPQPCLCIVTPTNDPEHSYPVLLPQDAPHDMNFLHAQPHHQHGQVASLMLTLTNTVLYAAAYFYS